MSIIFENTKHKRKDTIQKEKEGYAIFLLEFIKNILFEHLLNKNRDYLLLYLKEILEDVATAYFFKRVFLDLSDLRYKEIDNSVFEFPESYESRKFQFLFGLSACLDYLKRDDLKDIMKTIKKLIPGIALDLKNYAKIYQLMSAPKVDRFWNWRFLDRPDMEQELYFFPHQTMEYLLKLMSEHSKESFENLEIEKLDWNTLLVFLKFSLILNKLDINKDKKDKIQSFFERISKYHSQEKAEILIKTNIDKNEVQGFIRSFQKMFLDHSYIRKLFKNKKIISKIEGSFIYNIDEIKSKSDFISRQSKSSDVNLILSHPRNLVNAIHESFSLDCLRKENEFIQSEILKKCNKKKIRHNDFIKELNARNWTDNEVMLILDKNFFKIQIDLLTAIEKNLSQDKGIFEYHFLSGNKKIPVNSDLLISKQNVSVMIIDVSKLPTLEMFDPVEPEKELFEFQFLPDIGISVGIEAFSHNEKLMEFMLKNPPKWLIEKGDEKAQRDYLNQRVNIKILQGLYLNWEGIEEIGEAFVITD